MTIAIIVYIAAVCLLLAMAYQSIQAIKNKSEND